MISGTEPRVCVHDFKRPVLLDVVGSANEINSASPRHFSIEDCWARGRYVTSLFAPTGERSFAWRGDYIRDQFPFLPRDRHNRDIDAARLWYTIARCNGCPQSALQTRLGYDAHTVERILRISEQQDLLFRLTYWAPPGRKSERSPLVYWCDSGLLHRLLDERSPATMKEPHRGKSFEGFAIGALISAAGPNAVARVWRSGQDEIDLILDWPERLERWAIEITRSRIKKLSEGFHRGCDETEPTRAIIIQDTSGNADESVSIERMQLIDVLRQIQDR